LSLFKECIVHVIVVDDHPIVGAAIAMLIEASFGATVHLAKSYAEASRVAASQPDIELCLLDIYIPEECAHLGVRAMQAALPSARMVLFSGSEQDADLRLALDLGVQGYLPKSSTPEVVDAVLRLVLAGGTYLPSGIADLARNQAPAHTHTNSQQDPALATLTERQRMVLAHVSRGQSNKEIARDLSISPATVKAHLAHIMAALGAVNRTQATVRARDLGLLQVEI
jgi:DNA-binding NarL/FixJ family response regulator